MVRVLIRRTGALGDVLLTTPVIARLRRELGPGAVINVETGCPAAYEGNPDVSAVYGLHQAPGHHDDTFDLDLAYERQPRRHIVAAYMRAVFGDEDMGRVVYRYDTVPVIEGELVTIHAAKSWASRTLPDSFWEAVVAGVRRLGYRVLLVGSGDDLQAEGNGVESIVGKCSLASTVGWIAASRHFICSDSALLHFAGATDTRIIGVFTSVKAAYRAPWRDGHVGSNVTALAADVPCYGCLAEQPPPVTNLTCGRGDNLCVRSIKVTDVLAAMNDSNQA